MAMSNEQGTMEQSPSMDMALSSARVTNALQWLECIATKLAIMEQRQCDSSGEGTDASRMLEGWTRGENANVTSHAQDVLRKRVLLCSSSQATSYESIWCEKDFARAEKQAFKFHEQFVQGILSDHCDSDYEVSTSLAWLPIWRGKECMNNEM